MSRSEQTKTVNASDIIGPILPSLSDDSMIGPALPPNYRPLNNVSDANDDFQNVQITNDDVYGPILPENLKKKAQDENTHDLKMYGPSLPPSLETKSSSPTLVLTNSAVEDDETYGPLPPGVSLNSRTQKALEERALEIKLSSINSKQCPASQIREEWMTQLPKVGSGSLGLGAKHFRKNDRPDFSDRSSWTDTPQDKTNKLHNKTEKKVNMRELAELQEAKERDKEQSKMAKEYKKKNKRDKSLLNMHQNKLIKKQKTTDAGEASVRRPFSRETDLKVNVFDEAQKKVILKKAMHLDDRFSRGQTKFL